MRPTSARTCPRVEITPRKNACQLSFRWTQERFVRIEAGSSKSGRSSSDTAFCVRSRRSLTIGLPRRTSACFCGSSNSSSQDHFEPSSRTMCRSVSSSNAAGSGRCPKSFSSAAYPRPSASAVEIISIPRSPTTSGASPIHSSMDMRVSPITASTGNSSPNTVSAKPMIWVGSSSPIVAEVATGVTLPSGRERSSSVSASSS